MGKPLKDLDIDAWLSEFDADGNGIIDEDEFGHMVRNRFPSHARRDERICCRTVPSCRLMRMCFSCVQDGDPLRHHMHSVPARLQHNTVPRMRTAKVN